jgi:hypothetical protein
MKLIFLKPYYIEDHYKCIETVPIEYSSIEALRAYIMERVNLFKQQRFEYSQDIEAYRIKRIEFENTTKYFEIVKERQALIKKQNKLCHNTKKVDRDASWALEKKKVDDCIKELTDKLAILHLQEPTPPALIDFNITIGKLRWNLSYEFPLDEVNIDTVEILTLEDWLKQHELS